jgi:hypothetical protein
MTMAELLVRTDVHVLGGRRVPGCPAPIDHLAVGPGGVTVIGTGPAGRRDPAELQYLLTAVTRHVELIGRCLEQWGAIDVDVRGCLSLADPGGREPFAGARVRGIPLLGAAGASRLAARPGPLSPARVARLAGLFADALRPPLAGAGAGGAAAARPPGRNPRTLS